MDLKRTLGIYRDGKIPNTKRMIQYINLKLAALGEPFLETKSDQKFLDLAKDLISNYQEKNRLLTNYLCPADQRIQTFIDNYFSDVEDTQIRMPDSTFILDYHGIARVLSVPPTADDFSSAIIKSYRIKQGVLHNPVNDRRTTKGVFHVAEGGLPIPDDKKAVPKATVAYMLSKALTPPDELMKLPFTNGQEKEAKTFVSLYLRPKVSPEIKNFEAEKTMEIRFFVPGNLVSNLDFVESIFGNAGDPFLPENDAALDVEHWTGHTGCIILAPHLTKITKKEAGLPNIKDASERQKRDGMCWEKEDELYNDGTAFKITLRTEEGKIVTVIADNYFGYSKKEVKTQISFSANLFGNAEEEHAGGAMAFPSYNLGDGYQADFQQREQGQLFDEVKKLYADRIEVKSEGYGIDVNYPDIYYIPRDSRFDLPTQSISWMNGKKEQSLKLQPNITYMFPSGFKVRMTKNAQVPSWRLAGTVAEGTFCHKPSTVSGGGKSEISKSIGDSIIYGPFFVANFKDDFDKVEKILEKDYADRFREKIEKDSPSRPILSAERSLGSVIKLLTPAKEYTDEYNEWLHSIPPYIKGLVFIVKRFYQQEWGGNWREKFSVDIVDGRYGNELKYHERKLVASYLRVGLDKDGSWRTYKLRQDYMAADKLQLEDDITASSVVPASALKNLNPDYKNPSFKFADNCEYRFFQRPDEAIHRGYDKQAEADIATPNTFISNFAPLTLNDAEEIVNDAIGFDKYTDPIKKLIKEVIDDKDCTYFVSSSHPRIVDGKPSKNMRYLQTRPDLLTERANYIAEMGMRLHRRIPAEAPLYAPVNAVLAGRRNNPPEPGVRPLAVYNPIHYQELPELFMDFICSLTGKSPSTTGAGSEGALTKGPFNALCPITDLNNALVSFILTEYAGFTTAAGHVGPNYRVDHDISLLIPEIWSRLSAFEREPDYMIREGHLEKLEDFEHEGETILASRLGYRITEKFVHTFFGRVFENPTAVFNEEMLKPELQDKEVFVDGIKNIAEAMKGVAERYFADGSIEGACPPLKALLHIMVNGEFEGKTIEDTAIRNMFTRQYLLESEWYRDRLLNKQLNDIGLWQKHIASLKDFLKKRSHLNVANQMEIEDRLEYAKSKLLEVKSAAYLKKLQGTIGLDPIFKG